MDVSQYSVDGGFVFTIENEKNGDVYGFPTNLKTSVDVD